MYQENEKLYLEQASEAKHPAEEATGPPADNCVGSQVQEVLGLQHLPCDDFSRCVMMVLVMVFPQ